ncbi:hypothetical protein, partial [Escherichia coli]|uniref:hypothetical protein n=1 Tax=Escherichia coli TaxID=562 RepID=UPI003AEF5030
NIFETHLHPASDPQFPEFSNHAFLRKVTRRRAETRKEVSPPVVACSSRSERIPQKIKLHCFMVRLSFAV